MQVRAPNVRKAVSSLCSVRVLGWDSICKKGTECKNGSGAVKYFIEVLLSNKWFQEEIYFTSYIES